MKTMLLLLAFGSSVPVPGTFDRILIPVIVTPEAEEEIPAEAIPAETKTEAAAVPAPKLVANKRAAPQASAGQRTQYLERLILSVRALPDTEQKRLQIEAEAVFSGVCRSSDPTLALSCSFQSAAHICSISPNKVACLAMIDALVVERLNANRFISARERYEMMSRGESMGEALNHRYGSLVTAFSLSQAAACKAGDFRCLSLGIDTYCQNEARQGHLSYQSCAALIGLFIGRNGSGG